MGCIPVIAWEDQKTVYPTHISKKEFESISVLITEEEVLDGERTAPWARNDRVTLGCHLAVSWGRP